MHSRVADGHCMASHFKSLRLDLERQVHACSLQKQGATAEQWCPQLANIEQFTTSTRSFRQLRMEIGGCYFPERYIHLEVCSGPIKYSLIAGAASFELCDFQDCHWALAGGVCKQREMDCGEDPARFCLPVPQVDVQVNLLDIV